MKKIFSSTIIICLLSTVLYSNEKLIYQGKRSYEVYSTNIIKDKLTEFMWDKSGSRSQMNWVQANKYCTNLVLDDFNDWELPTLKELYYLADRSKYKPAINKNFSLQYQKSGYSKGNSEYWTRTSDSNNNVALTVNFINGKDWWSNKKDGKNFVRCIRHPKKNHTIVIDEETGLMWQDDKNVKIIQKKWHEAKNYCKQLNLNNYTDWRLPSIDELMSINTLETDIPELKPIFKNVSSSLSFYWSITIDLENSTRHWKTYKSQSSPMIDEISYIRCVRDN